MCENLLLLRIRATHTQTALALVWNGTELVRADGSDTEESDSEPPLTPLEQVRAILEPGTLVPPPLPVERGHARATAQTVYDYIASIPTEKRRSAHRLALSIPLVATSIAGWIDQQLQMNRREHTLKTALCVALNPKRTEEWLCRKSGGTTRLGHMHIVKGLALHLRMHPFTWLEVRDAYDMLSHHKPRALQTLLRTDAATLEAAAGLVVFQRGRRA